MSGLVKDDDRTKVGQSTRSGCQRNKLFEWRRFLPSVAENHVRLM
jgi:hypothetical protein